MKRRVHAFIDQAYPGLDDEMRAAREAGRGGGLRRGMRVAAELERVAELIEKGRGYVLMLEQADPDPAIGPGLGTDGECSDPGQPQAPPQPPTSTHGGRSLPTLCLTPRLLAQRPQAARARAGCPC
jgi:hypothetical protein